jgi:uncharacterized RDD family membrane protein YckC
MTDEAQPSGVRYAADAYDASVHPGLFVDILPRRLVAFAVDAVIVLVAMVPAVVAVLLVGLLGGWLNWIILPYFAIVGLGYLALTLGSEDSATIGMRLAGLEMRTLGGEKMYPLLAALHGLVFWLSVGLLTPVVLIVGLLSNRNRLLHDMLLGTVLMNAAPLHELERLRGT